MFIVQVLTYPNNSKEKNKEKLLYYDLLKKYCLKKENYPLITEEYNEEELITILKTQEKIMLDIDTFAIFLGKIGLIHFEYIHDILDSLQNKYELHYEEIKKFYEEYNKGVKTNIINHFPNEIKHIMNIGLERFVRENLSTTIERELQKKYVNTFLQCNEERLLSYYDNNKSLAHYYYGL